MKAFVNLDLDVSHTEVNLFHNLLQMKHLLMAHVSEKLCSLCQSVIVCKQLNTAETV